jgi:hypothetical protein
LSYAQACAMPQTVLLSPLIGENETNRTCMSSPVIGTDES